MLLVQQKPKSLGGTKESQMKHFLTAAALFAIAPVIAVAQQSLCGVWQPVEVFIESGPDAGLHTTDIQPGLMIFTDTYYAGMQVRGFEPRPRLSESATNEERLRAFTPFTANAGTYVLTDSTLTMTLAVSKNPNVMLDGAGTDHVRVVADSLWFLSPARVRLNKWVRIERSCDR